MELYFCDLTPGAQQRYLELHGIEDPEEGNFDVHPIHVFEEPEKD